MSSSSQQPPQTSTDPSSTQPQEAAPEPLPAPAKTATLATAEPSAGESGGDSGGDGSGNGSGDGGSGPGAPQEPPSGQRKLDELAASSRRIEAAVEQSLELGKATAQRIDDGKAELTRGARGLHGELGTLKADAKKSATEVAKVGQSIEDLQKELRSYRADVTPSLQGAQRDREELRGALASAYKAVSETQNTATETRREVQTLQSALEREKGNVARYRDELKEELGAVQRGLASLSGRVDERLTPDIKAVASGIKEHAERTVPALEQVKVQLSAVDAVLRETVAPQARATTEAVAKLAQDTRELDKHLRDAHSELKEAIGREVGERLGAMATSAGLGALGSQTEQALREVQRKHDQAQKVLDTLAAQLPADLGARLEKLSAELTRLGAATAGAQAVAEVVERIEGIERSVGMGLGERLGQKLEQLHGAIAATQKALDASSTAADVQTVRSELASSRNELQAALQLLETRLAGRIDTLTGGTQRAAEEAAAQARSVGELAEPVGAVKRSVGDALGYRLTVLHEDLKDLGEDVRSELRELATAENAAESTLARTVVPGLEQLAEATRALNAQIDKRSDRLEVAVADVAKAMARAVKERGDAVVQAIGQIGSQREQDRTALTQQMHQLRAEVTGPLESLNTSVGVGLAQRLEAHAGVLAELRSGTSQRLGDLTSTLVSVKERTQSLQDDLGAARSDLSTLAAAAASHQIALMSELVTIRTTTQEGLVGTLRTTSKDLADRVQGLGSTIEARIDALQRDLNQMGHSGAQQHAQVLAGVSSIRDFMRSENSGGPGRTTESAHNKLDALQLRLTELAGASTLQHNTVLSHLAQVHSSVTNSTQSLQRTLDVDLKKEFDNLFNQRLIALSELFEEKIQQLLTRIDLTHTYISGLKEKSEAADLTDRIKQALSGNFTDLEKKLDPITTISDNIRKKLESEGGSLDVIKAKSDLIDRKTTDIDKNTKDLRVNVEALGAKFDGPLTWRAFFLVLTIAIILSASNSLPLLINQTKSPDASVGIAESLKKHDDKVDKLLCLAEKSHKQMVDFGSRAEQQQKCIEEIGRKLASRSPRMSSAPAAPAPAPAPRDAAPQVTNTISICTECGAGRGGSSGTNLSCNCLGKTSVLQQDEQSARTQKSSSAPGANLGAPR